MYVHCIVYMSNVTEHHPINVCSLHSPGADPGGGAPGAPPPPKIGKKTDFLA
jgi:hypothetical protein